MYLCLCQREDKELMFAQAYHSKVRKTLENDQEVYEKFLQLFAEFNQNMKSIAEVRDISLMKASCVNDDICTVNRC